MARRRALPDLHRSGGFVGLAGLVCVLFLDLASYGFLPWWSASLLLVVWLLLAVLTTTWFQRHPARVALLPVLGVLAWLVAVWLAAR